MKIMFRSGKSGGGPPQSKTRSVHRRLRTARSVLECARPLVLSGGAAMVGILVGRLATLSHAAAAGVIFSRQNFYEAQIKNCERENMIAKCPCDHCGENIEFATEEFLSGSSVVCPHCGQETQLSVSGQAKPTPAPPPLLKFTAPANQVQFEAVDSLVVIGGTDCPDCGSSQTQRLEMAFAMGVSEKRGTLMGVDSHGEIGIGGVLGTSQTGLSISAKPPIKKSFALISLVKILLGVISAFFLLGILGSIGEADPTTVIVAGCILTISCLGIVVLHKKIAPIKQYNEFIYPKLLNRWLAAWICLRCGKRWIPEK